MNWETGLRTLLDKKSFRKTAKLVWSMHCKVHR